MTQQLPAKLSRPRLYDAVPRERLFILLDEESEHPALWIAAPPGAGKTTLVAGWLENRGKSGIWYQVDAGDADPASFFYYLGIAEGARPGRSHKLRPLPLLTPEHLADVPGFARRFFRELFDRLDVPAVLVLDNFQEAGGAPAFHDVVGIAIENAPPGISVLIASRTVPNEDFVLPSANQMLALIEWEPLKLTREETGKIAQLHAPMSDRLLDELHQRSGGWAAGLILLAERLRRSGSIEDLAAPDSLQEVFGYFAGQLFDRADAETRRMLMQLSYPPNIPASMAEALTGNATAARLLEQLYRRHLFTDRRPGTEPVYQFHALFRAFLQHRVQTEFDLSQQTTAARHTAQLLETAGQFEDAMSLRLLALDWDGAERLILDRAPQLIAQGRWRIVEEWIGALPAARVNANCWLLHWRGTAWIGVEPPRARAILENCHRVSRETGDLLCEVQAAAGAIETYFLEYANFTPVDRWIDVLVPVSAGAILFPSVEAELRVQAGLLIALTYRQPGHPSVAQCARRVTELLHACKDPNLRMVAAFNLGLFGEFCGRMEVADGAVRVMESLLDHQDVTVFAKGMALGTTLWYCVLKPDAALGADILARLEKIGNEQNLHLGARFSCILGFYMDARRNDLVSAQSRIKRFETVMIHTDLYEAASIIGMRAHYSMFTGRPHEAARIAGELIELYEKTGSVCHELYMRPLAIWSYVEIGELDRALQAIAEYRGRAPAVHMEWMAWGPDTAEARIALLRADDALPSILRKLFAESRARERGYDMAQIWCRNWMPGLCGRAIELGIEVENVRDYIREYHVDAPGQHIEGWPWQIQIRCLGRFEILAEDRQLDYGAKTPRKLLALLKAIIALGSRDVPERKLADALWPGEDGDTAHQSFNTAMHRLRKLLGDNSLIRQREGRISLDTSRVWVDALAFEARCALETGPDRTLTIRTIDLYRGEFLVHDDAPWAFSTREKLRARYLELVSSAARRFEQEGRHEEALDLYRRGIEADELAEAFHQGLMRCHHQVGRTPEALDAYRRMRELLARVHGIQPSPATEELYRKLSRR
jgi:LuxR family maltose regulon positive regulatory protein